MGLADLSAQMQKDRAGRKDRGTTGSKGTNEGGEEVRGEPDPKWAEMHGHLAAASKKRAKLHADVAKAHQALADHHSEQSAYHDAEAKLAEPEKGRNP